MIMGAIIRGEHDLLWPRYGLGTRQAAALLLVPDIYLIYFIDGIKVKLGQDHFWSEIISV